MKQLDHYETMRLIRPIDSALMLCVCGVTSENLGLMLRTADGWITRIHDLPAGQELFSLCTVIIRK